MKKPVSNDQDTPQDEHKIISERRAKLEGLREQGNAFPNDFRRDTYAQDLHDAHADKSKETLASEGVRVRELPGARVRRCAVDGVGCFEPAGGVGHESCVPAEA